MNNKRISVKDFIHKYIKIDNEEKQRFLGEYVLNDLYVNYEQKVESINRILKIAHRKKRAMANGKEVTYLHFDTSAEYMLYSLEIVRLYTAIDIDLKNSLEEFNMLNKYNVLNMIFKSVNKNELDEFSMLLGVCRDDMTKNEYEIHSYITKQFDKFGDLFSTIISPVISSLDIETIEKAIDNVIKVRS